MSSKPWTKEEDAVLRDMLANGHSFADVSRETGRTRSMVAGRASRLNIVHAHIARIHNPQVAASKHRIEEAARLYRDGREIGAIASELGITRRSVLRLLKISGAREPRLHTGYTDETIAQAFDAGKSITGMCDAFACSRKTILRALGRMGREIRGSLVGNNMRLLRKLAVPADRIRWKPREIEHPSGLRVKLLDLQPHNCRFPIGEPDEPDFGFCGSVRHGLFPYCQFHIQVAYSF